MKLLKLWWHCLVRNLHMKEDHRMCAEYFEHEAGDGTLCRHPVKRYCTCGYKP